MSKIVSGVDTQYQGLLHYIKAFGVKKSDRTGTGTTSVFGQTMRVDMQAGFPLLTTKKMHTKSIVHELLWFLKGSTNIKYLVDNDVSIWTEWPHQKYVKEVEPISIEEFSKRIKSDEDFAKKHGELGPVYGKQWTKWHTYFDPNFNWKPGEYNQIQQLIDDLKNNPDSRRMIVNAWNVGEVDQMLLPPCHYAFQCWTRELTRKEKIDWLFAHAYETGMERKVVEASWADEDFHHPYYNVPRRAVSLMWQQRSVDVFLGLPFNIASYGLLLEMIAQCTNMIADHLIFNGGDCHLYSNHMEAVEKQLMNIPKDLCRVRLNPNVKNIFDFKYEDITFVGYESHGPIKAHIAV